ncbi:MAG: sugar phosphate isomerase/epimerase family protein, partial [Clostridia bacterium]
LPLWTKDATKAVAASAREKGLHCSTFVAHFLGSVFSSGSTLGKGFPLDQAKAAVDIASLTMTNPDSSQSGMPVFVVPVPAFAQPKTPGARKQLEAKAGSRFRDIIGTLLSLCDKAGFRLALELLPGNVLGGSAAFMKLVAEPGFSDLGLLLDTGHFWAMGERVQDLPRTLGSHIVATHLCDNDGVTNLSLCPGDGTIPFQATLRALREAGYPGSLDLEIVCPKDQVEVEYSRAFTQFSQLADTASALSSSTPHPDHLHIAGSHTINTAYKETI